MALESVCIVPSLSREGNPEPEPFYGLCAFACDLYAEHLRLDQEALQAALETLNAQDVSE